MQDLIPIYLFSFRNQKWGVSNDCYVYFWTEQQLASRYNERSGKSTDTMSATKLFEIKIFNIDITMTYLNEVIISSNRTVPSTESTAAAEGLRSRHKTKRYVCERKVTTVDGVILYL